ncbi:MAG: galactose mutarotase [Bacteroidaceae bacterium]|nr:galactose mutarotase [Bacteroidaceae bacterium]
MENRAQENNKSRLNPDDFSKKIQEKETALFVLTNKKGMEVAITNYGAALLAIMVPDRVGNYANVILGHDSIEHVVNSPEPFLNTTIGRYGNRIAKGQFTLDGKEYKLTVNNGPNSLHGGPTGFHTRVWHAEQIDTSTLKMTYLSKDMEEGFPGNLSVEIIYHLDEENALCIDYSASTDKKTVVNLTNHAFFNLAGIACPTPSINEHLVSINADAYIPIDVNSIPTGEIASVESTPMDFRIAQKIGKHIEENNQQLINGAGYDHCYVLNKQTEKELTKAATYIDPSSGRLLEVFTTERGLQLYTGNWLNGFEGAHSATFPARSAVCFEAQCFPDTPNQLQFPTATLLPGEEYYQQTIYRFGIK